VVTNDAEGNFQYWKLLILSCLLAKFVNLLEFQEADGDLETSSATNDAVEDFLYWKPPL
jgi:hypothetical protein